MQNVRDAITTMRSRLELLERSEGLQLAALTGLSEMVKERLESIDRNQQLLLEAVSALEWRIEPSPEAAGHDGAETAFVVHLVR